jgi:vacuolar-type H+-ATPase subunit H
MKDILNEILEEEKRVDEEIGDARRRAREIVSGAERDAGRTLARAREKSQNIVQKALEKARTEASGKRDDLIRKAEEEDERRVEELKNRFGEIVDDIVSVIIQTEV